jgi:hypothetical protein
MMLAQQFDDRADKAVGRLDGRGGFLQRHYRIRACLVVGDCLELISFREKAAQLRINAGSSATSLRNCPWTPL